MIPGIIASLFRAAGGGGPGPVDPVDPSQPGAALGDPDTLSYVHFYGPTETPFFYDKYNPLWTKGGGAVVRNQSGLKYPTAGVFSSGDGNTLYQRMDELDMKFDLLLNPQLTFEGYFILEGDSDVWEGNRNALLWSFNIPNFGNSYSHCMTIEIMGDPNTTGTGLMLRHWDVQGNVRMVYSTFAISKNVPHFFQIKRNTTGGFQVWFDGVQKSVNGDDIANIVGFTIGQDYYANIGGNTAFQYHKRLNGRLSEMRISKVCRADAVPTAPLESPLVAHRFWRLRAYGPAPDNTRFFIIGEVLLEFNGVNGVASGGTASGTVNRDAPTDPQYAPANAFNLTPNDPWWQVGDTPGISNDVYSQYLQFDFGSGQAKAVNQVTIYSSGDYNRGFKYFKLQSSDDGTTWTTENIFFDTVYGNGMTVPPLRLPSFRRLQRGKQILNMPMHGSVDVAENMAREYGQPQLLGDVKASRANPLGLGCSLDLTTPGAYLKIPHHDDMLTGGQDWIFECTFRLTNVSGFGKQQIFSRRNAGSSGGDWELYYNQQINRLCVGLNFDGENTFSEYQTGANPSVNATYTVTVQRKGGSLSVWLDQTSVATHAIGTNTLKPSSGPILIGVADENQGSPVSAYINRLRYIVGYAPHRPGFNRPYPSGFLPFV